MDRKFSLNLILEALKKKNAFQTGRMKEYTDLVISAIALAIDEEERMNAIVREYERMQEMSEIA